MTEAAPWAALVIAGAVAVWQVRVMRALTAIRQELERLRKGDRDV